MTDKPTKFVDFALNDIVDTQGRPNKLDVPTALVDDGWTFNQSADRQTVNELFNLYGLWTRYFEERTNKAESSTVALLPAAGTAGAGSIIFVTDETGGPVLAYSDGTDWRRVTDGNVVSI